MRLPTRSLAALTWRLGGGRLPREFLGYGFVSALALAADWALLIGCTEVLGLHYTISATVGFCAGLVIAYALSVAFVFRQRAVADRRFEFAVFALIGLCGLGLTQVLLRTLVETAGLNYAQAKAPTAMLVFLFNFAARRTLLFSRSGDGRRPRRVTGAESSPSPRAEGEATHELSRDPWIASSLRSSQ